METYTGETDWRGFRLLLQDLGEIDRIVEELEKSPQRHHKGEIIYLPKFTVKDEHKPAFLGMILEMIISRIEGEDNSRNIRIRSCLIDDMDILHIFYQI